MKGGETTTKYRSPVRKAQAASTRALILDSLAAVIERGDEPTFAAIALEADVQERTVYRHFGTKDELYAAFWERTHDERIGATFSASDRASLLDLVAATFDGFDRNPLLIKAMLHSKQGLAMRLSPNDERQTMFTAVVTAEAPGSDALITRRTAAAAQVLYSAMAWEYLRDYWAMDTDEAVATIELALTGLLAEAKRRQTP